MEHCRNDISSESGQTLILIAFSLILICGFLGLAIDVGNARSAQRKMQEAADAAAIAAVLELETCGTGVCSEMSTASQKAVLENGLTVADANVYTATCTMPALPSGAIPVLVVNSGPCLLGSKRGSKLRVRHLCRGRGR